MSEKAFLIVDVGSTTTKAILIERGEDGYRVTQRGEAPTTVEKPDEDVMVGVHNAISQISRPLETTQFLATSSAGGGLQVIVCGLSKFVTAESAEKAALGAGALIMDVFSPDDGRILFEQMEALRKPNPIWCYWLVASIVPSMFISLWSSAKLLNSARPVPRFVRAIFARDLCRVPNGRLWSRIPSAKISTCTLCLTYGPALIRKI